MLDAHSLRAYPVPPLALCPYSPKFLPLFTEIREGFFSESGLPTNVVLGNSEGRKRTGAIGDVGQKGPAGRVSKLIERGGIETLILVRVLVLREADKTARF